MAYTTINKSTDYFDTKLYTGNASTLNITGLDFQPDLCWLKIRSAVDNHALFDSVRGVKKRIASNLTAAEINRATALTSFNSDGFTLGDNSETNAPSGTYASWNWKANGAGSSNTAGSTATTVSVNTTAGFSIVKWTGTSGNTTIGHGLGVIPSVVIAKNTGGSGTNWIVYHKDLSSGYYVKLNLTNAQDNANAYFTADPTNSILSLTGNTAANSNGNNMIAYCFNDVQGYSKFGSYTGNGNADGTFVYTGFKPAWIMIKNASSSSEEWNIWDNKRNPFNVMTTRLVANITAADSVTSAGFFDFTSNGFKIRSTANGVNQSGNTLIYMAFAENPFVTSTAIPATAR